MKNAMPAGLTLLQVFKPPKTDASANLPDQLQLEADVAASVQAIRQVATPTNTWTAYSSALRYFSAWMRLRLGAPLTFPVAVPTVQWFVLDHFGRPERLVTGSGHECLVLHPH